MKINFATHQHKPVEPKTEQGCSRQQLFCHDCGSYGRCNNKQSKKVLQRKYPLALVKALKLNSITHPDFLVAQEQKLGARVQPSF